MKRNEFYLLQDGDTQGPFTLEDLHKMWMEERLTLDTLYLQPGMKRCQSIDAILDRIVAYKKAVPQERPPKPKLPAYPISAAERHRSKWSKIRLLIVSLAFLVVAVFAVVQSARERAITLHPEIECLAFNIRFTNQDKKEWLDLTVWLNGSPPNGYAHRISRLKTGKSLVIPLRDFLDQRGTRFEPWRMKVREVGIVDGDGHYKTYPSTFNPMGEEP